MKRLALIAAAIAIAAPAMAQQYVVTPYGGSTLPPGYGSNKVLLPPGYGDSPGYPPPQQSFIIPNTNAMPSGTCFSNAFHRC